MTTTTSTTSALSHRLEQKRPSTIHELKALPDALEMGIHDRGVIGTAVRLLEGGLPVTDAHTPRAQLEDTMVAELGPLMRAKLAEARAKGRGGWNLPEQCPIEHLWDCLHEHIFKLNLDMVDVANLAGMLDWRLSTVPGERERLRVYVMAREGRL